MAKKPQLHVIRGTLPPDTPAERVRKRVRQHAKPASMISCPRCGGRETIDTKIGATRRNGKLSGGTKVTLCVGCLLKGQ